MAKKMVKCVVANDKGVYATTKDGTRVHAKKGDTVEISETMFNRVPGYFITQKEAKALEGVKEAKNAVEDEESEAE